MQICIIGTGYVGLVAGTCLADMGNDVICLDENTKKIEDLANGIIPIYEPGLEELLNANVAEGRLRFSTDLANAVKASQVCFIAVGTPQDDDGSAQLDAVYEVAKNIAKAMNGYKVIVNKSTVPVGTAENVEKIIKANTNFDFDVVSNPEFLKQGTAVEDFLSPDRVIIGSNSKRATDFMQEIYSSFLRTANRIVIMDVKSAEMTKYAANAFLATKISFANEMANLCEKVGADAEMVRVGITTDKRIGNQFLFPGIGYGGSCFPKDIKAMLMTAQKNHVESKILSAVDNVNQSQRIIFLNKILNHFNNDINGKVIGVWGLAFKPKTDDMREAPAVTIIEELLKRGAKIQAFDPKAMKTASQIFGNRISYTSKSYDALYNADCMVLFTEWNEFRRPDFDKIKQLLKRPVIFDGRNIYNPERLTERGFIYHCIGRKNSSMVAVEV